MAKDMAELSNSAGDPCGKRSFNVFGEGGLRGTAVPGKVGTDVCSENWLPLASMK